MDHTIRSIVFHGSVNANQTSELRTSIPKWEATSTNSWEFRINSICE